jgi:hypothetical protein
VTASLRQNIPHQQRPIKPRLEIYLLRKTIAENVPTRQHNLAVPILLVQTEMKILRVPGGGKKYGNLNLRGFHFRLATGDGGMIRVSQIHIQDGI